MSYLGISVKEVVENVNANVNGWFLPSVQRPYVWGSRYESEKYIAKLFDSILRGYPIGGFIVWNNNNEMPYREFLQTITMMIFQKKLKRVNGRDKINGLYMMANKDYKHFFLV